MMELTGNNNNECPFASQCDFIRNNNERMPELVNRTRQQYCSTEDCCQCARFYVYEMLDPLAVPPLMLPDQVEWSQQIIKEHHRDFQKRPQPAEVR